MEKVALEKFYKKLEKMNEDANIQGIIIAMEKDRPASASFRPLNMTKEEAKIIMRMLGTKN